jgi:ABC-type amino acid transport substrate-binding protein
MRVPLSISFASAVFILSLCLPVQAHHDEYTFGTLFEHNQKIIVSGSMIPHIFHPVEPGAYNQLLSLLTQDSPDQINLVFQPIRRAQQDFLLHRSDCYFISDQNMSNTIALNYKHEIKEGDLIFSNVVNQTHIKIYTLSDTPTVKSLDELQHMIIGADPGTGLGYALKEQLPHSAHILPTESVDKSIELLKLGRVSAIVAYDIDINAYYWRTNNLHSLHADKDFNIHTSNDCLACWRNEKTIRFMEKLNMQLDTLKNNGQLDAILMH